MNKNNPEEFMSALYEEFGGFDKFNSSVEESVIKFEKIWNQDYESIGRVLRAHLAVEYFVNKYIEFKNPNLNNFKKAKLSFAQKIELLSEEDKIISDIKPGIKRLNAIRNGIAHKLQVHINNEDRSAFLNIIAFQAMRNERAKRLGPEKDDPLSVLEQCAKFAASMFQSASDPNKDLWHKAFEKINNNRKNA